MKIILAPEQEHLIQSLLKTGKYETAEQVINEALRLLETSNHRQEISLKIKKLFDKTQGISGVQEITEEEIAAEIEAYRRGE